MKQLSMVIAVMLGLAGALPAPAQVATLPDVSAPPVMAMADSGSVVELGHATSLRVKPLTCGDEAQRLQLWLDGMDTGLRSIGCDAESGLLTFDVTRSELSRNPQTDQAWNLLLRDPFHGTDRQFTREVRISVVKSDGKPLAGIQGRLRLLDGERIWTGLLLLAFGVGALVYGAVRTGMLRDAGPPPAGAKRSFSLSRVQMVWWFSIVFLSYVLLWLLLQDLPTIPTTVLGLVGIASGTALTAAAIDSSKVPAASRGFWIDISTDTHGAALARVQQIVWTVMFGIVFISKVLHGLAMPDFDASVLVLMGISSGTYLGSKVVPEQQSATAPAGAAATTASAGATSVVAPAQVPATSPPPVGSPPA